MKQPKVLVVGINPWIDNTGINTLINFFSHWGTDNLAHLYTRQQLPNTAICERFFRISETAVMQSVYKRSVITGQQVCNNPAGTDTKEEQKHYQKKHTPLMSLMRELVWLLGKWKTPALKQFLDEFDADVLFFPVYSGIYMCRLQNFIRKYTKKPVILYSSDDNYSYQSVAKDPLSLFLRFWLRKQEKKLFDHAAKVLVIAPKQKEEYDRLFKTDCGILTKGIDFSVIPYEEKNINSPIKLVYTGKLIIGRWKSLAAIAEALGTINRNETRAELDIYTTDTLTEEQKAALNRNGCSVKGALALNEVQKVQREADVLIFVESLEPQFKNAARLSFSTKITDYLKNGKCIFAIGDRGIAPIDYFNRYDAAITASTYEEIGQQLTRLIDHPAQITKYSKKAYECGKEHHSIEKMDEVLRNAICNCVKERI